MKKNRKKLLLSAVMLLLIGEVVLRYFGLGQVMTYIEHPSYEYFPAPNQNVSRWGNNIVTNELGMRSKPLNNIKKKRVVLKLGDSVLNGGSKCSNNELASTLLENELKKTDTNLQVLNVSAGSWGPDNAYNYLLKNGHFGAELIVAVFNSHDFNDNMHHQKVVGKYSAWPSSQPFSAVSDLMSNYAWPKVKGWFGKVQYDYLDGIDDSRFNPGWHGIIEYCNRNNIKLLVYLHPETSEIKSNSYNEKGRKLIDSLGSYDVNLVQGLNHRPNNSYYLDNIHQNAQGQKHLAEVLYPFVQKVIN